jgi:hypothetical protein
MKVAELIAKLQTMPQDATVVIDDADTGWQLHVQTVDFETVSNVPVVAIGGDYDERF